MDLNLFSLFAAGLGTFFTPCVLPLIPIYLAILLGAKREDGGRFAALIPALSFIIGFSLVFIILGLGASTLGGLLAQHRLIFTLVAGLLILLFGLKFLGVIHIGFLERDTRYHGEMKKTRFQPLNAFLMGFFFAFGWTPCVGPILGSVLSWTAVNTNSPLQGALYLSIFSSGFAVPMLLAAIFTTQTQKLFDKIKPRLPVIEKALGAILVLVALMVLADAVKPMMVDTNQTQQSPAAMVQPLEKSLPEASQKQITKPQLIEFFSPNCPACRAVAPAVEKVVQTCQGKNVDIQLLDVSDTKNLKTALENRVRAIPTFLFIDEKGNEVARLLGVQTEENLKRQLSVLMGHECADMSRLSKESL